MFICDICGKRSERGEAATMYLRAIREKEYFNMKNLETTYGWEIVKEGKTVPSHKHPMLNYHMVNDRMQHLPFPYFLPTGMVVIPADARLDRK